MMERSWDDLVKYNAVEMTLRALLCKAWGQGGGGEGDEMRGREGAGSLPCRMVSAGCQDPAVPLAQWG